eukprot:TRINITY_DN3252_c0_g2_i2.p2 TRINITY_DN3252_c0_g2~~TRINITY_DN3252_c0_g2_i2.p2  ORF type:complete len:600 (-),score=233.08 TRINITY_DN3252_c0_g2_i2:85-1884(-)
MPATRRFVEHLQRGARSPSRPSSSPALQSSAGLRAPLDSRQSPRLAAAATIEPHGQTGGRGVDESDGAGLPEILYNRKPPTPASAGLQARAALAEDDAALHAEVFRLLGEKLAGAEIPTMPVYDSLPSVFYEELLRRLRAETVALTAAVQAMRARSDFDGSKRAQLRMMLVERLIHRGTRLMQSALRREFDPSKFTPEQIAMAKRAQRAARGFVARLSLKVRKKQQIKRGKIAHEILSSELSYTQALEQIVLLYDKPLRDLAAAGRPVIPLDDLRVIMSDIEVIMNANSRFLDDLRLCVLRWSPAQRIGDLFLAMGSVLRVYTAYVENYPEAIDRLAKYRDAPAFVAYAERLKVARGHLESLLIMPIQRIPRYVMLLEDLLKNTWRDHQDYDDIAAAVITIREAAQLMNERKRAAEGRKRIFEIDSALSFDAKSDRIASLLAADRQLVREGSLMFVKPSGSKSKKPQPRQLFLFSDMLLIASAEKKGKLLCRKTVRLHKLLINDDVDPNGCELRMLVDDCDLPILHIIATSPQERDAWLSDFRLAITLHNERQRFIDEQQKKVSLEKANLFKQAIQERFNVTNPEHRPGPDVGGISNTL